MKLTLKERIAGPIMLILMVLGIVVPVGIIADQKQRIATLEKQVKEFELEFYDDIFGANG